MNVSRIIKKYREPIMSGYQARKIFEKLNLLKLKV